LLCIIHRQFEKAAQLLKTIFDPCIAKRQDIFATRGALSYAKLYLSTGDHKKALHYINLAREINEKTFYLPFDLQLRVLENICFYKKGEYDFAQQLTVRNLKFLHSQEADSSLDDYKLFFRILAAFIKCAEEKRSLPEKFRKDHERIGMQYRNLYCNLLPELER
jgi:tetratricopeptide (TPR) repeat protein